MGRRNTKRQPSVVGAAHRYPSMRKGLTTHRQSRSHVSAPWPRAATGRPGRSPHPVGPRVLNPNPQVPCTSTEPRIQILITDERQHEAIHTARSPSAILPGHAHRAWAVPGCDRSGFIEEEHAVGAVAATGQRPEGRPTIQPGVDAAAAVAAEHAGAGAAVRPAIRSDDLPGSAGTGGHAADSKASRARLASGPPRYSPVVPSLRTTRWHGTTSGIGLCEQALAAARTADGFPAALATVA